MRKVLYVEQNLDGTTGGSHYCLLEMVRHLDRERFTPSVLFYQENALIEKFASLCPVYVIPPPSPVDLTGLKMSKSPVISMVITLYQKTVNLFKVKLPSIAIWTRFIKKHEIDIVHLNNSVVEGHVWIVAARLAGGAVVTHNRGFTDPNLFDRFFIRRYDAVVSISRFLTGELERRGVRTGKNFKTIYDGIDSEEVIRRLDKSSSDMRRLVGIDPDRPVVGIVGNVKKWKGQDVVIRACAIIRKKHPRIACLIAGAVSESRPKHREYMRSLRALIDENGLKENIYFLGFRDDIPDVINCLDVLVHASVEPEPLGRVILEGMVLKTPVVASALGGPLEIIEDGENGMLVPPGDPESLARAVDTLLSDSIMGESIAEAGYSSVTERFAIERNIEEIQSLYDSLFERDGYG